MVKLEELKEEMSGVSEILEDKRIENWAKSLEGFSDIRMSIYHIRKELSKDIEGKDLFTKKIFFKWRKELGELLFLPGLWYKDNFIPWEDLEKEGKVTFDKRATTNLLFNGG